MSINEANNFTRKIYLNYYRGFLRCAYQLNSYNFRDHLLRKIKYDFRSMELYIVIIIKIIIR